MWCFFAICGLWIPDSPSCLMIRISRFYWGMQARESGGSEGKGAVKFLEIYFINAHDFWIDTKWQYNSFKNAPAAPPPRRAARRGATNLRNSGRGTALSLVTTTIIPTTVTEIPGRRWRSCTAFASTGHKHLDRLSGMPTKILRRPARSQAPKRSASLAPRAAAPTSVSAALPTKTAFLGCPETKPPACR